ncbi:uncharacterized protein LOC117643257 isoform X2 [Thrips palmi]|uniref:Uncharacterized protein LOC117643257 isoform X2 n=1 Tax=Thrips palmi TaxID=161013 RepID=A0A6P8YUX7_THRPL|nr:uncharacterized protein LOC117643257 isoform X2 [Thrips palmi]XP_034237916.1 uncharacterized protein LOC117643257 isoform X2 [Thrips palmi]XP_034237917.1 uncharacterized protein LOC117643257 isoform X2 [Thrips palmi]
MAVSAKLQEWGLGHLQDEFRDKGVRKEALCLLAEDDVNALIPAFGDRLVFKHHLKLLQQSNNNNLVTLPFVINGNPSTSMTFQSDSVILDLESTPSTSQTFQNNSVLLPLNSEPIPSTSQTIQICRPNPTPASSTTEALRGVVKKTKYGRELLRLKRGLRLRERRRISDFIVNLHVGDDDDLKILPSEFKEWAEQLSIIFPKDPALQSLWYTPRQKVGNQTIVPNGPLLAAYYGTRREISDMNDECDDDEDEENIDDVEPLSDNVAEDIHWLKSHLEPWCSVTEKWQSTAKARKSMRDHRRDVMMLQST